MNRFKLFLEYLNNYFKVNTLAHSLLVYAFFVCVITVIWQKLELYYLGYVIPNARDGVLALLFAFIITIIFKKYF